MKPDRLTQICERLPIFPLAGAVLLPGELLPLHVFEPRYRALVRHCVDGDGVLGLATLVSPTQTENDPQPAIHPVIGLGQIVQHQPLPDGRSHLVLEFVGVGALIRELSVNTPFRQVLCTPKSLDNRGVEHALQRLQILVIRLGAMSAEAAVEAQRLVNLDAEELVDGLARKLLRGADARLAYLSADRMVDRVLQVEDRLSRFLGAAAAPTAEA